MLHISDVADVKVGNLHVWTREMAVIHFSEMRGLLYNLPVVFA